MSGDTIEVPKAARVKLGEIELYRVIGALLIVTFHIRQNMQVSAPFTAAQGLHRGSNYPYQSVRWFEQIMSNVDVAVDFFFVTSAFLVTLPWARALINGTELPRTRAFVIGRFLRIVPLYWGVVLVIWTLRNHGYPGDWRDLLEHLTFTQWLDSTRIFYTDGPAWSLGDEVWMYALVPLLIIPVAYAVRRLRTPGQRVFAASVPLALIAVGSIVYKYYVDDIRHEGATQWAWRFGVAAKLDVFVFGMIAAMVVALVGDRRMGSHEGAIVRLLCAYGVIYFLSHRVSDVGLWNTYAHTVCGLASAVLIGTIALSRQGRLSHALQARWLSEAGALTFAVYISHETILDPLSSLGIFGFAQSDLFRNLAVGLPVAILLGFVLHHVVEQPAQRLRGLWDARGRRIVESYDGLFVPDGERVPVAAWAYEHGQEPEWEPALAGRR